MLWSSVCLATDTKSTLNCIAIAVAGTQAFGHVPDQVHPDCAWIR